MQYSAVVFDLDGTLLDTLEDIAASANRALASLGYHTHPVEAFKTFVGDGVYKLVSRSLPPGKATPEIATKVLMAYRADYAKNWNVKTKPYPGVPEMLNSLQAKSIKLAVLSNKPDVFTQDCVTHLLSPWKFDVVLGASDHFPHKPDPASALEICNRMNVRPEECIYLGDTSIDMKTAVAAGMFPVGVTWGFRSREELEESGAKKLIDRPEQLLQML